jgi:hypothetical protein
MSDNSRLPDQGYLGIMDIARLPLKNHECRTVMDLIVTTNTETSGAPGITATEFNVMHGPLRVGRIRGDTQMLGAKCIWTLSIYEGPDGMRRSGTAATTEEACAEVTNSWRQWLAWAGLTEQETALQKSPSLAADSADDDPLAAVLREAHLAARLMRAP